MAVFGDYAQWYDVFYQDKDYAREAAYVAELLKVYAEGPVDSLLDVGCGTGGHAVHLAEQGIRVHGIDRSEQMIVEAKRCAGEISGLTFEQVSVGNFHTEETFDAAVALFHVVSYLTTDVELKEAFQNISCHLNPGGLFIFDFWYGPAVLSDPPIERRKEATHAEGKAARVSSPVMDAENNMVDVHMTIHYEHISGNKDVIREMHRMRYLFIPELESMLDAAGFALVRSLEWMHMDGALSVDNWNGLIIAQKKVEK